MSDKPKLGLDVDGVVADFAAYCLRKVNLELGTALTPDDWTTYGAECLGPAADEIVSLTFARRAWLGEVEPYPEAAEACNRLGRQFELHFLTSVPQPFLHHRTAWLHRLGVVPTGVYAVPGRFKGTLAADLGCAAVVEDSGENALSIEAAGVPCVLIDRPWNRAEAYQGFDRYGSLSEVADRVVVVGGLFAAVERAGATAVEVRRWAR